MPCCIDNGGNTGVPSCAQAIKNQVKAIYQRIYDSTGAKNYLDPAVIISQVFLDAGINNLDYSKRLIPVGNLKTNTGVRAKGTEQTFEDQTSILHDNGIRNNAYFMAGADNIMEGQIKSAACEEFGEYLVDADGSITGMIIGDDGFIYPLPVDKDTFSCIWNKGKDAEIMGLEIDFKYKKSVKDKNWRTIFASKIEADVLGCKGLIPVSATYSAITTAGFTVKLNTIYTGTDGNLIPVEGLVSADIFAADLITPSSVQQIFPTAVVLALTSFTESLLTPGEYAAVFAVAQTVADKFKAYPKFKGYDFTEVYNTTVTI